MFGEDFQGIQRLTRVDSIEIAADDLVEVIFAVWVDHRIAIVVSFF